jgi:hypothetical protein
MKKLIFVFAMALAATGVWAQSPAQGSNQEASQPRFAFESTEHDFGNIPHRSPKVECSFTFTNSGNAPLVITRTLTSCNCVKVEYPKKPVAPGQQGQIVVTYEVNKKEAGVFYKVIEIYSNAPERRHNLIVRGRAID